MNVQVLSNDIRCLVGSATVLAVAFLSAGIGPPSVALVTTGAAVGAVLLTFVAITVNTYRNARPDRSMGRLLHDPDRVGSAAAKERSRR